MAEQPNEINLILRIAAGNEAAFRQIFDLYRDKLFGYVLKFTKSRVLAEEVVQEVFIKIWENRERLNPALSFRAYLYKITQHLVFDFLKRAVHDQSIKKELIRWVETNDNRLEDNLTLAEYEEIVRRAVDRLPPQCKLIFQMSRDQYMSHEEIARQLGISKNTVKVQIVKAVKFIKTYFYQQTNLSLALFYFLLLP